MNKRERIKMRKRNIIDDDYLMSDVQPLWFCCNLLLNPSPKKPTKERKEMKGESKRVWGTHPCVSGLNCRSSGVGHSTPDPLKPQVSCRRPNMSRHPDNIRPCSTHPSYTKSLQHPVHHQQSNTTNTVLSVIHF